MLFNFVVSSIFIYFHIFSCDSFMSYSISFGNLFTVSLMFLFFCSIFIHVLCLTVVPFVSLYFLAWRFQFCLLETFVDIIAFNYHHQVNVMALWIFLSIFKNGTVHNTTTRSKYLIILYGRSVKNDYRRFHDIYYKYNPSSESTLKSIVK